MYYQHLCLYCKRLYMYCQHLNTVCTTSNFTCTTSTLTMHHQHLYCTTSILTWHFFFVSVFLSIFDQNKYDKKLNSEHIIFSSFHIFASFKLIFRCCHHFYCLFAFYCDVILPLEHSRTMPHQNEEIQSDHVYLWQLPSPASSSKHILLISNLPPECEFNNKDFLSFGFRVFASYVSDKDWKISLQNFINPEFDHDVDLSWVILYLVAYLPCHHEKAIKML